MKLCIFAEGYPTQKDPFMPFIRELVVELSRNGVVCSVIAPQSVTRAISHKLPIRPWHWKDNIGSDLTIDVYQPYCVSFSHYAKGLSHLLFTVAAKFAYKKVKKNTDVLYSHFWHMGVVATKVDKHKPLIIACGESSIAVRERFCARDIDGMKKRLRGVIYVSEKCKKQAIELHLHDEKLPYIVSPNGYDPCKFFKKTDKLAKRNLFKWPHNAFVISFVGSFDDRKGVMRLSEAIRVIDNPNIYTCFIGAGNQIPDCDNILHRSLVAHDELVDYLNASDIFVLPTKNEGCCNAIIEALACGLPVISSNQEFNDHILDDDCSIRINPGSVPDIASAICELYNNQSKRMFMSNAALKKAKSLTIKTRALNIKSFIEKVAGEHCQIDIE